MQRAIFLDRDGVIVKDKGYVHRIEDLEIIDGAVKAIKSFNNAGYLVIIVSNQAGIARGYCSEEDVIKFNEEMVRRLNGQGAHIDAVYFCPHHFTEGKIEKYKKNCNCRKPKAGMLLNAAKEHGIGLAYSWMIGDRESDIEAGENAGCNTILIGKEAKDLKEAAEMVEKEEKLKSIQEIKHIISEAKKNKKRIVFTNGCFDILHPGHVHYLKEAKKRGDVLIVGLNSDKSVKKIKGDNRPINKELDRAYILAALSNIDYVLIFEEETPIKVLEIIKPNTHVKGGDWKDKKIPEQEVVEKNGGNVVFIDFLPGYSTTKIIERINALGKAQ